MNTAGSGDPRIRAVEVTAEEIVAHLVDGRVISVPLAWSARLGAIHPQPISPPRPTNARTNPAAYPPDLSTRLALDAAFPPHTSPRAQSIARGPSCRESRRAILLGGHKPVVVSVLARRSSWP